MLQSSCLSHRCSLLGAWVVITESFFLTLPAQPGVCRCDAGSDHVITCRCRGSWPSIKEFQHVLIGRFDGCRKEPADSMLLHTIFLSMIISANGWSVIDNGTASSDDVPLMRRQVLSDFFNAASKCTSSSVLVVGEIACAPNVASASPTFRESDGPNPKVTNLANFPYRDDWTGSNLKLLSISDAASLATSPSTDKATAAITQFEMGRWPDPILRRQATPIPRHMLGTDQLKVVGSALRKTAQAEGAVGLAAQQCGVDGRMLWIDTSDIDRLSLGVSKHRARVNKSFSQSQVGEGTLAIRNSRDQAEGLFLVNPRITRRSSEMEMLPWTETCLVLPPKFSATVLRDASISVDYETLDGETKSISLDGELARCVQHEMDHDRGILLVDHIDLVEMEGGERGTMANIERENHSLRMTLAYERYISESTI